MRGEEDGDEREEGQKERAREREREREREGYMQVLSELWRSGRYINSFISAADSTGYPWLGSSAMVSLVS